MKLHLRLSVTATKSSYKKEQKEGETTNYADVETIIPGNPLATLFRDVKIKLNGVYISESSGLYPYISQHLFLTKIQPVYRRAVEESGMIFYDHQITVPQPVSGSDEQVVGLSELFFKKLNKRTENYQIGSSKALDLTAYLFTDLTASPQAVVVPPTVSVEIELHPNPPSKSLIMSKLGKVEPTVAIETANLIIPRVTPSHSVSRPISHQFMRVSAQPIFIPPKCSNYHGIVTFSGPIPSRLTLFFASMKSFDGNYADNMYASDPNNIQSIDFNVAGRHYPTAPIVADFAEEKLSEMYLRTAESLRFSLNRTQLSLPSIEDYSTNQFIYSIDISDDFSADSTWTTSQDETGSVAMSLKFSKETPKQLVAILIAENVATLKISQNGEVEVEE